MDTPQNSRQLLLSYVLDEMSPQERERIDTSLILDQEFSDSFQQARYDLIDAYVTQELSEEMRRRVERGLLQTENGKHDLSLAIALRDSKKSPVPTSVRHAPVQHGVRQHFRLQRSFRIGAFALAACAAFAFLVFGIRHRRTSEAGPPGSTGASIPARARGSSQAASTTPPEPDFSSAKPHVGKSATVLVFAMPFATTRGTRTIPIRLSSGIRQIDVEWALPSAQSLSKNATQLYFLDVVSDKNTMTVLPQEGKVALIGSTPVAHFLVSTARLPNGEYIFRVHAKDHPNVPLAESSVRISR